jgi:hypothetical protein
MSGWLAMSEHLGQEKSHDRHDHQEHYDHRERDHRFVRRDFFPITKQEHHRFDGRDWWFDHNFGGFSPSDYTIQTYTSPISGMPGYVMSAVDAVRINAQGLVAGLSTLTNPIGPEVMLGYNFFVINNGVVTQTRPVGAISPYDVLYKTSLDQTWQTVLGSQTAYQTPAGESESGSYVVGMLVTYSPTGVGLGDSPYVQHNGQITALTIPTINGDQVQPQSLNPVAVNDAGVIIGNAIIGSNLSLTGVNFIYDHGKIETFAVPGALGTQATAINDAGEIVGYYEDDVGGLLHQHGFIDMNKKIQTFDVPGAAATAITGINDKGQIVGVYTVAQTPIGFSRDGLALYASSGSYAFVATPQVHGLG